MTRPSPSPLAAAGLPQLGHAMPARQRGFVLRWSLAGMATLVLAYAMALLLEHTGRATYQFAQTVLWCALPYAVSARWIYKGAHLPAMERSSFILAATSLPYLLTPLGFALAQQPYSRGAVLLSYLLATVWFLWGHWLQQRRQVWQLAYLDPSVPQRLEALVGQPVAGLAPRLQLQPWQGEAAAARHWDGVVIDERASGATCGPEQMISALRLARMRLYTVEQLAELLSGRKVVVPHDARSLWDLEVSPSYDLFKRGLDFAVCAATLPLWLPLCALLGLAVRCDSPGPALFSQIRVGRDGQPFRLWKLRSMQHHPQDAAARFARTGDARITRLGRVLRRTRLDELPQLWNVLCGHMSLIGPRPEQQAFVEEFTRRIPAYAYRHLVRPGLTGWAQVQQGYAGSEAETATKLSYDLYYLAHYSIALDLLIAYKTVRIVATGFGAR